MPPRRRRHFCIRGAKERSRRFPDSVCVRGYKAGLTFSANTARILPASVAKPRKLPKQYLPIVYISYKYTDFPLGAYPPPPSSRAEAANAKGKARRQALFSPPSPNINCHSPNIVIANDQERKCFEIFAYVVPNRRIYYNGKEQGCSGVHLHGAKTERMEHE